MRFFSFKILILCILLPPIFYVFSVQYAENYLQRRYAAEIEDVYIGDTQPLLDGNIWLKDAVSQNINRYLQESRLISLGVKADITVITKQGTILYPPVFENESDILPAEDSMRVAADNFKLMNEGLVINLDLKIRHNTLLSNVILLSYIFFFLLVLYFYYRSGLMKSRQADLEKSEEIERLLELEKDHAERLVLLEEERDSFTSESEQIKKLLEKEKNRASKNEDGMIEEIIRLEEKLSKNLMLQGEKETEISALREQIVELEKGSRKETKQKTKSSDIVRKRLRAVYKNIFISDRAIDGFLDLAEDLKIKGEEIIYQLNEDPQLVSIKRKVFGKKSRLTVLEVIFGYKGRLYFRRTKEQKIEILAIGTKNSQTKDLEFLDNLSLK
ncbi:MAG: hypothetical protein DRI57_20740 [Deltaproteobacteria bacterium]|nr:MAG: hypothetical protein DRI57_20740 [Deltaproteobacteria bacterium]